jgi:hypothetical protein
MHQFKRLNAEQRLIGLVKLADENRLFPSMGLQAEYEALLQELRIEPGGDDEARLWSSSDRRTVWTAPSAGRGR